MWERNNYKGRTKEHEKKVVVFLIVTLLIGTFSIEAAKLVGKAGRVISADLQTEMLDILKNKIKSTGFEKIILLHKCKKDSINLSKKLDFALCFYVVHEVPNQKKLFKEIYSILKKDSKLLLIEPSFHVSKKEFKESIETAQKAGFKIHDKFKVFLSRGIVLRK